MDKILLFAILGLANGAVSGMVAQGAVLVYRGSGIVNFAQGAMAMVGAYAYYAFSVQLGLPTPISAVLAIGVSALVGVLQQVLVLRPMRHTSPVARVITTLGTVLFLENLAYIVWGQYPLRVPSLLPAGTVNVFGNKKVIVGLDTLIILGVGIALTLVLIVVYRKTKIGRLTTAVAENEFVAASVGRSPDAIAAANWAAGGAISGLAGILIAPLFSVEPTAFLLLIVPALSAALVGQFKSFGLTLVAALGLAVASSEITAYVTQPGWQMIAPFAVVVAYLLITGKGMPLRGYVFDRLPRVGTGRLRPIAILTLGGAVCIILLSVSAAWSTAISVMIAVAIMCLSVVVITGYTGQLSLAQYVLAGVGAIVAGQLFHNGVSFLFSTIITVVGVAIAGALIGLPALRIRGVALAIVTFSVATVISSVVLNNPTWAGGAGGIQVPAPTLFGIKIDAFDHPSRYGVVLLILFILVCIAVANLRRGRVGRSLIAVRSSERAAASLGIRVAAAKLYGFAFGTALAAIGGISIAFTQPTVDLTRFDVFTSLFIVAIAVVGGVGYIPGAIIAATLFPGGIATQVLSGYPRVGEYLTLLGGLSVIIMLRVAPDGQFELNRLTWQQLTNKLGFLGRLEERSVQRRLKASLLAASKASDQEALRSPAHRGADAELSITGLSVRFGGVRALEDVTLTVRPGEVHGLIGPNGAGKTTLIDATTGLVAFTGKVQLGAKDLTSVAATGRARAGLARSFQSLELFEDLTVRENLAVASGVPSWWRYVTDVFAPGPVPLSSAAVLAMRDFELEDVADRLPAEISFGQRKAVAIARAVAARPAILLLDEPAAGLDGESVAELERLIRTVSREWGIGVLLVEHKVDLVMSVCDRITVLVGGKFLTSGSPEEVRRDNRVRDAYLGHRGEASPEGDELADADAAAAAISGS